MKVKILRNTMAGGRALEAGKVYDDVSDADAAALVRMGKAEEVTKKTASKSEPKPGAEQKSAE